MTTSGAAQGGIEEPTIDAIRRAVSAAEVELDPDADVALSGLLNTAQAKQLVEVPAVSPNSDDALRDLSRLVEEMIKRANKAAKGSPRAITLRIVEESLRTLCPLPPWC
jgi:hypothetical protein